MTYNNKYDNNKTTDTTEQDYSANEYAQPNRGKGIAIALVALLVVGGGLGFGAWKLFGKQPVPVEEAPPAVVETLHEPVAESEPEATPEPVVEEEIPLPPPELAIELPPQEVLDTLPEPTPLEELAKIDALADPVPETEPVASTPAASTPAASAPAASTPATPATPASKPGSGIAHLLDPPGVNETGWSKKSDAPTLYSDGMSGKKVDWLHAG